MVQQKSSLQSFSNASAPRAAMRDTRFEAQPSFLSRTRASNGTLATAKFLGPLPGGKKIVKDTVGSGNSTDFLRVDLTEKSRVKLILFNRSEKQITASILDANGAVVSTNGRKQLVSVGAGNEAETLVRGAEPGVYYVRIKGPASGRNRYEVNLFANRTAGPVPLPCDCGI